MYLLDSTEDLAQRDFPYPRILVPTMGALHAGHCSLIKLARSHAGSKGSVIVSIFVNPAQFDREEDLTSYPQTLEADLELCEQHGADCVFVPKSEEIYHPDHSISLLEKSLSQTLCGRTRPGHFDGVCLIVNKLFNITKASHAVFGEKDFQQLAIIRRMARDLNMGVKIIPGATVREPSGLAMSSRNLLLTEDNKKYAPVLYQSLLTALDMFKAGETSPQKLLNATRKHIKSVPMKPQIDYLELVDAESLAPLTTLHSMEKNHAAIAAAVFFGEIRLIDHIHLT